MNINDNNARLRVALLSINPRTQALLDYFFLSTGRSAYLACSEADAEAAIFDFDHPESRLHWEAFHSASGLPGIALSIHEQHLPYTVWVPKPVAPMALLSAANAIHQQQWQAPPVAAVVPAPETVAEAEPVAPVVTAAVVAETVETVQAAETTAVPAPEAVAEPLGKTAAAPVITTTPPVEAPAPTHAAAPVEAAPAEASPAKQGWLNRLSRWLHHEDKGTPAVGGNTTAAAPAAVAEAVAQPAPVAPAETSGEALVATPETPPVAAVPVPAPEPEVVSTPAAEVNEPVAAPAAIVPPVEVEADNAPVTETLPDTTVAPVAETVAETIPLTVVAEPVAEAAPLETAPADQEVVTAPAPKTPEAAIATAPSAPQGTARLVARLPDADADATPAPQVAPAPVHKITAEEQEAERRFCGEREDMSAPDIQSAKDLYYKPSDYLLAALKEAYLVGGKWRVPAHVDFEHGGITYIPETNQAYLEFPETDLAAHCAKPLPKFLKVRMIGKNELPALKEKFAQGVLLERFDARLWLAGLETAQGRLPQGTDIKQTIYLKHWPNLTRLQMTPHAMRIAALWATKGGSLLDTAETLKIPQRHVFAFYNAASALDLITDDNSHIRRAEKRQHRSHGMFSRLFKWLRN